MAGKRGQESSAVAATGPDAPVGPDAPARGRRLRSSGNDPTIKNPGLIVQVANPLPGENAPLSFDPERTQPITQQEALGVMRRRKRAELTRRGGKPGEVEAALPTSIGGWNDAKENLHLRMLQILVALGAAHAEAEGTHFTALLEELLTSHLLKPPRDPQEVAANHARLEAATVGLVRFEQRLKSKSGSYEDLERELAVLRAKIGGEA